MAVIQRLLTLTVVAFTLFIAPVARAEPQRATVGVYVDQVASIDLKNNAFTIDFWLWFRTAPHTMSPLDTFELIDGRINSKTNVIKKVLPSGEDYAAVRVNATIHSQWDLHNYPFDDHELEIAIEDSDLDATRAVFVADVQNQGVDPGVAVSGWNIEGFDHELSEHLYHSNYGDTSIAANPETHFSRYVARVHARRHGASRFLRVIFPLLVAVLSAWCAFFIRPKDASPRVSVSIGALFASAAATIAINSQLPDITYATISDKTVFLALGMIAISLISTVGALSFHYAGNEAAHRRLDKTGGALFPVFFLVALVFIVR